MNGQYLGERTNLTGIVDRTENDTNSPILSSDPYVAVIPVEEVVLPVEETEADGDEMIRKMDAVTVIQGVELPMGENIPDQTPIDPILGSLVPLLSGEDSGRFRTRWNEIQGKFVDEPRTAVQQADTLVSEVVEQISQMFTSQHSLLEEQWNLGKDVSTEDLRKTLQNYRSFFNRLVI